MNILNDIADKLRESKYTDWDEGYLEDWAAHAEIMKSAINFAVPLLQKSSTVLDEKDQRIQQLEQALADKDSIIMSILSLNKKIDLDK